MKSGYFPLLAATLLVLSPVAWGQPEGFPFPERPPEPRPNPVVLLHGLARTEASMAKMQRALESEGFDTCNIDYPSRKFELETLAEDWVLPAILDCVTYPDAPVSFVTHSMGGILVRYLAERELDGHVGRVVMLSPPNGGSEVVDRMGDTWLFKLWNGPAGEELGTDSLSVPNRMGPPSYEVGVITGRRTINPILSLLIPGPDDGKVSVDNARLEGMTDFLVVPASHTFIMKDGEVIRQSICFLRSGTFCGSD